MASKKSPAKKLTKKPALSKKSASQLTKKAAPKKQPTVKKKAVVNKPRPKAAVPKKPAPGKPEVKKSQMQGKASAQMALDLAPKAAAKHTKTAAAKTPPAKKSVPQVTITPELEKKLVKLGKVK
jgi:endonuclease-3